ncbi:hypothetical protein Cni_G13062 [Canna indica]|uniref:Uncharacterized protein n=1 Tax=Canna indica TaxID=4628 RepID=A0AAQ3Q9J5_9LILI|nr:hypothetical protein Cni_G13062 [Canna indica]
MRPFRILGTRARSTGVCLLTAAFVGMTFTIQFIREFTCLDLHRSIGGVLALPLSRELSPVVTFVVAIGRGAGNSLKYAM